jgi:hypothetical protein
MNVATIHPSVKVNTLTIPMQAGSAMAALRDLRETLAKAGREIVNAKVLSFEGTTPDCTYILRVEYVKAGE